MGRLSKRGFDGFRLHRTQVSLPIYLQKVLLHLLPCPPFIGVAFLANVPLQHCEDHDIQALINVSVCAG
jgi:hypothetical protein